jgi:hypothetical protein
MPSAPPPRSSSAAAASLGRPNPRTSQAARRKSRAVTPYSFRCYIYGCTFTLQFFSNYLVRNFAVKIEEVCKDMGSCSSVFLAHVSY